MSKEKIIKILIIFSTTILFVLFGINKIFAISINLSDKLDIGPILGSGSFDGDENFKIDNQVLYSDIYRDYSNTTAFKCLEKDSGKCRFGIWNTTVFYLFDLNNEGDKEHSFSTFFNSNIGYSLVYKNDLKTRKIFLRIGNNNKELLDLTNMKSCGNDNPNLCLFAFNFSGFYLNKTGFSGVYLRLVDTYDYGDLSNVSMDRLFLDRTESTKSEESIFSKFWRGYTEWFNGYDGGYGARISDLKNGVISMGWGYSSNDYAYCISHDGYFNNLPHNSAYYNCGKYKSDYFSNRVKMLTSIGGPEANILNYTDVVIRDFLAGNKDHLKRTIKDVIGDFKIKGIISGTGSSSNPENWKGEDQYNCNLTDVGCHIKNFTTSIGKFTENIWSGFSDIIKGIFSWIYEKVYGFFEPIVKPVWDNLIKYGTPVGDVLKNFLDFSSRIITLEYSFSDLYTLEQGFLCSKVNNSFFQEHLIFELKKPLDVLLYAVNIINPFPPPENSQICTSLGMKKITYGRNTIIDNFLLSFFFFLVIIFAFKSFKKYS